MDNIEQSTNPSINVKGNVSGDYVNIGGNQYIYNIAQSDREKIKGYLDDLANEKTDHLKRRRIGDQLRLLTGEDPRWGVGTRKLGSDIIPEIQWLCVVADKLYIAKYPVTVQQFQAFCNSKESKIEGFKKQVRYTEIDFLDEEINRMPHNPAHENYPIVNITWYQAMAFCYWLKTLYQAHGWIPENTLHEKNAWTVTLPTDKEWLKASGIKEPDRPFPWGKWNNQAYFCNDSQVIPNSLVAVGLYPQGAARCEAEDMVGNIWELTRKVTKDGRVVAKGGAYNVNAQHKDRRNPYYPDSRLLRKTTPDIDTGFRPVWVRL